MRPGIRVVPAAFATDSSSPVNVFYISGCLSAVSPLKRLTVGSRDSATLAVDDSISSVLHDGPCFARCQALSGHKWDSTFKQR